MMRHPLTWFLLGWLFSLLFSPTSLMAVFGKNKG